MKRHTRRSRQHKKRTRKQRQCQRGGATACRAITEFPMIKPKDPCPKLCKKPGGVKPFEPEILTRETNFTVGHELIYAIPVDEPEMVYIFNVSIESYWNNNEDFYICETSKKRPQVNHNCLVNDRPVIAAGEIKVMPDGILQINNSSGHYRPSSNSLDYVKCLFEELGFNVEVQYA
jgi:hypothetical protein